MPSSNKKWFKAFNNPELKEEKWLEPSDALFQNISNEIFEKKKKRKLAFWLFGFGSLLILLIGTIRILDTGSEPVINSGDLSEVIENKILLSDDEIASADQKSIIADNGQASNSITDMVSQEIVTNTNLSKSVERSHNIESKEKESILKKTPVNQSINFVSVINKNDVEKLNDFNNDVSLKSAKKLFAHQKNDPPRSPIEKESLRSTNLIKLLTISDFSSSLVRLEDDNKIPPALDITVIDRVQNITSTPSNKTYSLGFSLGLSQWNFLLNNNYVAALDPADFSFDNGKGINVGLNFQKQISPKWSFITSAQMEQIDFVSGHNSIANYDLLKENGGVMNNDIALTMASPLGFIESEIVVNRADDTTMENTDLVLDLHNDHHITNLSVDAGLSYSLFKSKFINISPTVGLGANYFSSLSNELSSFDIDRNGFK